MDYKEYVPTLQKRQKWPYPKRNLAVGDLVLILDESLPRGCWPLGLVEEVFPDAKGSVRRVVVRTAGARRLRRDVRKAMSSGRGPFGSRSYSRVTD